MESRPLKIIVFELRPPKMINWEPHKIIMIRVALYQIITITQIHIVEIFHNIEVLRTTVLATYPTVACIQVPLRKQMYSTSSAHIFR